MKHIHWFRRREAGSFIKRCRCGLNRMGSLEWSEPDPVLMRQFLLRVIRSRLGEPRPPEKLHNPFLQGTRGLRTSRPQVGKAGYCGACKTWMPDGPDACLGDLDGVSFACCGHGTHEPYVTMGESDVGPAFIGEPTETLRGPAAEDFFRVAVKS